MNNMILEEQQAIMKRKMAREIAVANALFYKRESQFYHEKEDSLVLSQSRYHETQKKIALAFKATPQPTWAAFQMAEAIRVRELKIAQDAFKSEEEDINTNYLKKLCDTKLTIKKQVDEIERYYGQKIAMLQLLIQDINLIFEDKYFTVITDIEDSSKALGAVDISLSEVLSPTTFSQNQGIWMDRKIFCNEADLWAVDNSSVEARRPAACPRDPEMLINMQVYCTEIDRTGSRGQAAGRRDLNCQQPLDRFSEQVIGRRKMNGQQTFDSDPMTNYLFLKKPKAKRLSCFFSETYRQSSPKIDENLFSDESNDDYDAEIRDVIEQKTHLVY